MIDFDILKEGQEVVVFSEVHDYYKKPIKGKVKRVINPTHYMIESEEIYLCDYPVIITFHLLTESMDYETKIK